MAGIRQKWHSLTLAAMSVASNINPYESDLQPGVVIPAVEAVDWNGRRNCDIRPRLPGSNGQASLIDSGSMITATARKPEDKLDTSVKLVAVNGSEIKTYGTRKIEVKIGRKAYAMEAVICDINQDILGMDFLDKYRLGLEWDDFDQSTLWIVDKKAQVKTELQIVTVPMNLQRTKYLEPAVNVMDRRTSQASREMK